MEMKYFEIDCWKVDTSKQKKTKEKAHWDLDVARIEIAFSVR